MPEYHLPEFNRALSPLMGAVDETVSRIRDFRAALQGADSPSAVITEYELLRKQHSTVKMVIEIRRRGKGVR